MRRHSTTPAKVLGTLGSSVRALQRWADLPHARSLPSFTGGEMETTLDFLPSTVQSARGYQNAAARIAERKIGGNRLMWVSAPTRRWTNQSKRPTAQQAHRLGGARFPEMAGGSAGQRVCATSLPPLAPPISSIGGAFSSMQMEELPSQAS
jgi:hypothetical protein